jgi:hypothetical protein
MTPDTETYQSDTELILHYSQQFPLTIRAITLTLTKLDGALIELRLTFQVAPELYQRINTEALFNLKPELRGSFIASEFTGESNVEITASLKPDLLQRLTPHLADVPAYLKSLNQEQPDNPLFSSESWLALQVKQQQTAYRTFWDYLSPEAMTADCIDSKKVNNAIINFFTDRAQVNLHSMSNDTVSQAVEEVTKGFEEGLDTASSNLNEESIARARESMAKGFEELAESSSSGISQKIFSAIVNFFTEDDWPFTKVTGEPVWRTAFQGKNGKLNCYAKARTNRWQFVFYSISPVNVPESKRLALAEFIARANYGTIIGNFELDFSTGEIRYKTSIDIEGSTLTFSQIKQLVYTNTMMMDEYLPGIKSVIDEEVEAADAIASIESPLKTLPEDSFICQEFPITIPPDEYFTYQESPITISSDNTINYQESPPENLPSPDSHPQAVKLKNTPPSTVILSDEPKANPENNSFSFPLIPDPYVNNIEQLPTNYSPKIPKHIGETLSLLTLEEIADFDRVRVMLHTKQPFAAKTLMTKLKKQLTARLSAEGSTIFLDSKNFFEQNKTPLKTANLIRRYWNLFERSTQLIKRGENNAPSIKEVIAPILLVVEKLADRIEARIAQLVASYVDAKLEIECLIEIEQLTEQLTYCLEKLKNSA